MYTSNSIMSRIICILTCRDIRTRTSQLFIDEYAGKDYEEKLKCIPLTSKGSFS